MNEDNSSYFSKNKQIYLWQNNYNFCSDGYIPLKPVQI